MFKGLRMQKLGCRVAIVKVLKDKMLGFKVTKVDNLN
jgi:hypothetical protein